MAGFWRPPPGGARGQLPPPAPPRYATEYFLKRIYQKHRLHHGNLIVFIKFLSSVVDMCGVEGKRRLCDLNVTSSSPALATRRIRIRISLFRNKKRSDLIISINI